MSREPDPITVLHLDDDPALGELVVELLGAEKDRFEVRTETDVEAALEALSGPSLEFDCVVSDYEMPALDGLELLERVRERHPTLPFILFTGKGSEEVASEAISAGVTDYLQKEPGRGQFAVLANRIENAVSKRRAEAHLGEAAARMELALAATDSGLWEWRIGTDEVVWDEHLEALVGLEPGEFGGTYDAHREFLHPEDEAEIDAAARAALAGDGTFHEEFRMVRADGQTVWIEGRGQLFGDGEDARMVGLATDVTDQKERERALRESEERYRRLVETAPTPIFIYSTDRELVYANDAAVDFLGVGTAEEALGLRIEDITHPDSRSAVEARIETLVEARVPVPPVEETLVDLQGRVKHAILAAAPVTYGGEPAIQTVATDITSLKQREAELERQVERLDQFASIVSHDLQNPLNVAQGRVELAIGGLEDGSAVLDDLERAAAALERMEALVLGLLSLARFGEAVSEPGPVKLATVARECWNTVATGDAALEVDTSATVRADRVRLRQLLENLVRNAVEHGGEDVRVRIGDLEGGFFVEDDGPGIPPEDRERVFEYGHSTGADGNGFGLAIVRGIAEAHDWTVAAVEGSAGGARIEFRGVDRVEG